ncbi:MAG: MoaD/ThiS family protein [Syntrophomonadaceae bacterium]
MEIRVRVYGILSKYAPDMPNGKTKHMTIPEEVSVKDLITELGIPVQAVGLTVINGSLRKVETILHDQDDVQLFPLIEGG